MLDSKAAGISIIIRKDQRDQTSTWIAINNTTDSPQSLHGPIDIRHNRLSFKRKFHYHNFQGDQHQVTMRQTIRIEASDRPVIPSTRYRTAAQ